MKNIVKWLLGILAGIGIFFAGFMARQPQINKLKKQVEKLQKDNKKLIELIESKQSAYRELLVQHKALKALQHKKKAESKELLESNLVFQYAIREYLELLLKRVKYEKELAKEEIVFFDTFEKAIDGKELKAIDFAKVREYVMDKHSLSIKKLKECDYTAVLNELSPPKPEPVLIEAVPHKMPKFSRFRRGQENTGEHV